MRFILFSLEWETRVVEGESLADACISNNIYPQPIHSYAKESDIEGLAGCGGCTEIVGDTLFCRHDLESYKRGGVPALAFEAPFPQLSDTEVRQILWHFIGPCPGADEMTDEFDIPSILNSSVTIVADEPMDEFDIPSLVDATIVDLTPQFDE